MTAGAPPSTLYKELINNGLSPVDAQCLDDAFTGQPDFLDGMADVAAILANKGQPGAVPPTGEPWKSIFTQMGVELATGADHDSAWRAAIGGFDPGVQFALTAVIQVGMKAALQLEQLKGKKKLKTVHYLKELANMGYSFRLNVCDDSIEVNGERISDGLAAKIRCEMRDRGYTFSNEIEDAYYTEAYQHPFHPVRDYLSSLQYDGGSYIAELASYFQDDYLMFDTWLRRWLVGAVAKAFTGSQNPMLVLDGPQNLGKSSFARWLCPLPKFFLSAAINPEDKDYLKRLIGIWIWEVGELGGTISKANREALKNFLTLERVQTRLPYAHYDINKPALASMIGTVNNSSGILNDSTGNRRFMVSKLTKINWDYTRLDIHKIWAEAMAAYLSGENWNLTPDEKKKQEAINEEYSVEDPIENLLRKYFKLDSSNYTWWMASSDIAHVLEDPYQGNFRGNGSKATLMALAETMKRLDHKKGKQSNVNGYFGIAPTP